MSIESRSRQYGKVFEHWQIREFLGSGSGGKTAVFRLSRVDSSRGTSALKVVNLIEERGTYDTLPDFCRQEYETAREECSRSAEQEVWLMDELRGNTNIVDYLDHTFVDWSEETSFGRDLLIRMELLTDLRRELRNGRMFTEEEILKIGRDISTALIRCHSKNILHRDVKPENIFRNKDGDYKLGDFGVSRVLDACPGALASTGIGTYEYWPPEQMTGSYDKRVDIYSLGLVLYELSNRNRLPFASSTYVTGKEVSLRLSGAPLTEPTEVSPTLAQVILKACAFKPEDRYQSAEDFLKALDWLSRKNQSSNAVSLPESSEQETPSVCYDTVPAQPSAAPKAALETQPAQQGESSFETQPAQRRESSFETQPAQHRESSFETQPAQRRESSFETQPARSGENSGSALLMDQNRRKEKKSKWLLVLPAALLLCAVVGLIAWPRTTEAGSSASAKASLEAGKNNGAAAARETTGGYRDSAEQLEGARPATDSAAAEALTQPGKTAEDAASFSAPEGKDRSPELRNQENTPDTVGAGTSHTVETDKTSQITALETFGDNQNGAEQLDPARPAPDAAAMGALAQPEETGSSSGRRRQEPTPNPVSVGAYHTVGLKTNGSVIAAGTNSYGQFGLCDWQNIIAVAASRDHTVGLKADGTVVSLGYQADGRCNVDKWTDMVAVSAGLKHTIGLKADGTVVAVGDNGAGQCNVGNWTDIVAISAGAYHTVGLKSNGTVVAAGGNTSDECEVGAWTDIVAISAGSYHTVGLKSDGTVVAAGNHAGGRCDVGSWTGIVAVSAGSHHTVGLKSDGSVVAVGNNNNGQCKVGGWTNIVSISAGASQTLGLKSDGSVVAVGNNAQGQLDVQEWRDIMLPESRQR